MCKAQKTAFPAAAVSHTPGFAVGPSSDGVAYHASLSMPAALREVTPYSKVPVILELGARFFLACGVTRQGIIEMGDQTSTPPTRLFHRGELLRLQMNAVLCIWVNH